MQKNYKRFIKV